METRPLFIDDFEPIEPCRLTYNVFTDFTTDIPILFVSVLFSLTYITNKRFAKDTPVRYTF